MGIIKLLRDGSWWLRSKSDPRWNRDGRGSVGLMSMPTPVGAAIRDLTERYGDPPTDLEWGYMKD